MRSMRAPLSLRHSLAITAQQRSTAAFSRLGDSVTTYARSRDNISGKRGVICWSRALGSGVSSRGGRHRSSGSGTRQRFTVGELIRRNKLSERFLRDKPQEAGLIPATFEMWECCQSVASHIIVSLPGTKRRHSAGVGQPWRDGERRDDSGRERNSETVAASLSVSDDRWDFGDGAPEEHRRREERDDQRAVFSGAFSGQADYAGRADHRGDGADRRVAVAAGDSGARKQTFIFRCSR